MKNATGVPVDQTSFIKGLGQYLQAFEIAYIIHKQIQ